MAQTAPRSVMPSAQVQQAEKQARVWADGLVELHQRIGPRFGRIEPRRRALRRRGIIARIARRGIEPSDRLGRHRWVVERSQAWLVGCRRLGVRYERRADILHGFAYLAAALINLRFLTE